MVPSNLMVRAGSVALIGLVWLWLYGCDERVVAPGPPETAPVDYPVYFADQINPLCYRYRVVSGTLDTIDLPFIAEMGMDVSPDGSTLYVAGATGVAAVDLATGNSEVIWSDRAGYGVTVSPDGRYLELHGGELNILELTSLTVVHRETEAVYRGVFSANSRRFYAPEADCEILQIGLGSGAVSRAAFPDRCYGRIAVADDESKWYLYDLGPCYGRLEVFDRAADSVIFSDYFHPGWGFLELSRDETYAFFTNPGPVEDFCSEYDPELSIAVYDINSNQLADEISTRNIPTPVNGVDSTLVIDLVATPDGRWLIGLSLRGDIVRVDLKQMALAGFHRFDPPRPIVQYPCCQTNL
jgi:hypothetical protein